VVAWEVLPAQGVAPTLVGVVYADDDKSAVKAAIEEYKVRPVDQKRHFVRPR
jgi:hypothetical protein